MPESSPASDTARRLRVLVVDDDALNREVALAQLADLGHQAEAAGDGAEALRMLEQRLFDAVLMDCEMPLLDGYEATAEVRQREGGARRTWIIALTANPAAASREACLAAGMDDFLLKPAAMEELQAALACVPASGARPAVNVAASPAGRLGALLPQLIALFLRDAPPRIAEMRRASEAGDFPSLADAAHALKGSAANLGAGELVELSGALEAQGRSGSREGLAERIARLEAAFRRAHAELSQML
jgi:two-component system, sensor histidine kinase and response regulator